MKDQVRNNPLVIPAGNEREVSQKDYIRGLNEPCPHFSPRKKIE